MMMAASWSIREVEGKPVLSIRDQPFVGAFSSFMMEVALMTQGRVEEV